MSERPADFRRWIRRLVVSGIGALLVVAVAPGMAYGFGSVWAGGLAVVALDDELETRGLPMHRRIPAVLCAIPVISLLLLWLNGLLRT